MNKGKLITFEGGEGAGKTIQIKLLSDWLFTRRQNVVITREPGGTVISEQIRNILLNPHNLGMAFTTEVLLFQSARAQIYRELIIPSLQAGKIVLADRSRDSSTVYQGMVRGFGVKLIEDLNDLSTQKTVPDLTILLDVPVKIGLSRRNGTTKIDRLDMERKEFHEKVRKGYLEWAEKNKKRFVIIDASKTVEENHAEIIEIIEKRLKL